VSGAGDKGGGLSVRRLETGAVYVDGKIASGTADQIAGGVFIVYGGHVDQVTTMDLWLHTDRTTWCSITGALWTDGSPNRR